VIAASGILVIVAFVTLIVGVFNTGLGLIWTSIAASILAAIFLALGVMQGNKRRVAPAGGPAVSTASAWSEAPAASTAVMERAPAPAIDEEEEARPSLTAVPAPDEESFAPEVAKPAAKPRARSTAASPTVVVVPDRDKFHKETCRYAKNPAAMTMTKAAARRQGYTACGTCKP
jgi:hypothetical protein